MVRKCTKCGQEWIVSAQKKIPESGYECPHCEYKRLHGEPIKRKEQKSNASNDT